MKCQTKGCKNMTEYDYELDRWKGKEKMSKVKYCDICFADGKHLDNLSGKY